MLHFNVKFTQFDVQNFPMLFLKINFTLSLFIQHPTKNQKQR